MAACAACRARAEQFRDISKALADLPDISPSASFDAALRARIAAEPVRRGIWSWLPSPRFSLAVAALVIFQRAGMEILHPKPLLKLVGGLGLGLVLNAFAGVFNLLWALYLQHTARRARSPALAADAQPPESDTEGQKQQHVATGECVADVGLGAGSALRAPGGPPLPPL